MRLTTFVVSHCKHIELHKRVEIFGQMFTVRVIHWTLAPAHMWHVERLAKNTNPIGARLMVPGWPTVAQQKAKYILCTQVFITLPPSRGL